MPFRGYLLGGALVSSAPTKQKEHQQSKMSTNRMVGALLALASGKAERSPNSIQASPFSKYYYKTLINKPI